MYMVSEMSGQVDEDTLESQTAVKTMFAFLHLYSKTPEIESLALKHPSPFEEETRLSQLSRSNSVGTMVNQPQISSNSSERSPSNNAKCMPILKLASKASLEQLKDHKLEKAAASAFFERRPKVKGISPGLGPESASTIRRWELASSAIEHYPILLEQHLSFTHNDDTCLHLKTEELLVRRVQNWPWDDLLRDVGGLVVGLILWLANFAYGAIHAAAWNDHFPTVIEKWLWRSSAVYIGFCGGLWIVLNYAAQAYRPLNEFWERWMDGGGRRWQNVLLGIPVVICGASLVFARGFIVIEAFISIRSLPAAAYETPNWSQIFPHF